MAGDLSGRLPVDRHRRRTRPPGDNLNDMLERIEALMRGLKEVSDNIAHDLKTPLTRLRNRCEEALRTGRSEADYRAALEATIEESDGLIRTFNALLMIARAESGQARDNMIEFEAAEIVRGVGELYEPLAEEKGLTLDGRGAAAGADQGQSRAVQPGARQSGRQRDQIRAAGRRRPTASRPRDHGPARKEGDRVLHHRRGSRPRHRGGRPGRVVERFVRLEQSRSQPGSGLGLSLAAAVARLHGGELRLEDNAPGLKAVLCCRDCCRCRNLRFRLQRPLRQRPCMPAVGGSRPASRRSRN